MSKLTVFHGIFQKVALVLRNFERKNLDFNLDKNFFGKKLKNSKMKSEKNINLRYYQYMRSNNTMMAVMHPVMCLENITLYKLIKSKVK